jgi:hypothetical protein
MMESKKIALDKHRVKEVILSLKDANRKLLAQNGITEKADDFIYLTMVMTNAILPQSDTTKPIKPTPI